MATRVVSGQINRPDGAAWGGASVKFRPADDSYTLAPDATYPIATVTALTAATGAFAATLAAGLDVEYEVALPDGETFRIFVPTGTATTLEALRFAYDGVSPIPPPDLQAYVESVLAMPAATEITQDTVGAMVPDTATIDATYDDGAGTLSLAVTADSSVQKVDVRRNSTGTVYSRRRINFIAGANITLAMADDAVDNEVDVTIDAAGASGYTDEQAQDAVGTILTDSGSVDFTYNDAANTITAAVLYGGTGAAATAARSDHGHTITGAIKFTLGDPGGAALTVGTKGYISVPFACTITGWRLLLDASSTTTLDVWKDTYANYPPTDADRIAGTEKPAASAAIKAEDTSLSSWTTAVAAGDVLGVEVEANSAAKFAELTILYSRTI